MTGSRLLVFACAFGAPFLISPAFAETKRAPDTGSSGSAQESSTDKNEDGARRKQKPSAKKAESRALAHSKDALQRSREAALAKQKLVSQRLAALSKIWVKVAKAEQRALRLEAQATKIERSTLEFASQATRARSLVEQTEARRSRALARLKQLGLSDASPQSPIVKALPAEAGENTPRASKEENK